MPRLLFVFSSFRMFGNFTYTESNGKHTLNYEEFTNPTVFNYTQEDSPVTAQQSQSWYSHREQYPRFRLFRVNTLGVPIRS